MDCIKTQNQASQVELLNQADQIRRLEQIFGGYNRASDVFLPSDNFYNEITGPESLEAMADEIFRYLRMKHRSIEFHIDPDQNDLIVYERKSGASQITLGWQAQADELLAGSLLVHGILHHILEARVKLRMADNEETEALTDLATIYAGLCVPVLNGLGRDHVLGSMGKANYISECFDFFKEHRVVDSLWKPYVRPEIIALHGDKPLARQRYIRAIRRRLQQNAKNRRNLVVGSLLTALLLGFIGVSILTKPKYISAEMQAQRDTIALLKFQHEQCEETVKRKLSTWDTSDIFMQRQIDADKSRCTSLRNRYNYEVAQYNEQL